MTHRYLNHMTEPLSISSTARPALLITLLVAALFLIRLTGPSDLMDFGQEAPTAYVLDAVKNGHWIVQRDAIGDITSKPPLYTWLAAAVSTITGEVNRWTLCAPAALATWALALVILTTGIKYFGRRAGLLAALMYVLSQVVAKQVALVRTDGLFSLTVALTALLAYRAWQNGKGWELFWLAAAAATLTKGPLGIVLGASGLLAAWWERRTGSPAIIKGKHWTGIFLFLAIVLGWFGLAYWDVGRALTDRLLVRELYGRAVSTGKGSAMLVGFYLPTLYFLARFAPWSIACLVGLWRVVKWPSPDAGQRRFERFLFCWFAAGLVIFSLAAHHRADLLFPLVPPAALLAGRELARWVAAWSDRRLTVVSVVLSLLFLIAVGLNFHMARLWLKKEESVAQTLAAEKLAGIVHEKVGVGFPLVHQRTSPVLQLRLGTYNPLVTAERAAQLLQSSAAAFVAVRDADAMFARLPTNSFHILAEVPRTERTHMAILGNRPVLAWSDPLVTLIGPLQLEMSGIRKFERRANEFWFENESHSAYVEVTNESDKTISARVHFTGSGAATSEDIVVPAGGTRKVTCK